MKEIFTKENWGFKILGMTFALLFSLLFLWTLGGFWDNDNFGNFLSSGFITQSHSHSIAYILISMLNAFIGWYFGNEYAVSIKHIGEGSALWEGVLCGLAIGFITGTVVLPVFGTIIGLILGAFLGLISAALTAIFWHNLFNKN